MATRPVKLKLLPRSAIKAKNFTRLVGQVVAGSNVTVTKAAGNFTVSSSLDGTHTGIWAGDPIGATFGGTGQSSYTTGDLLYASSPTALSKLNASTSGYALISAGVGVAPAWSGFLQSGTGAVTRTWQDKARDVLHATDFGVVGDSVTDNSPAFAVIAALGVNKTVILPAGNILVSSAIVPAAAQTFIGQGPTTTTIYTTSATANVFTLSSASVSLSGFSILSTVTRSAGWAIDVSGSGAHLSNLSMTAHQNGIRLQDGANSYNIDQSAIVTKGGGIGLQIGSGTGSVPIAGFITNITMSNSEVTVPTAHLSMVNVGDVTISNLHAIGATYNVRMIPGTGQGVYNVKATMLWADSAAATGYGLYGVTSGTGKIGNVVFSNSWFAGLSSAGNVFLNGAGGDIDGIEFTSCTSISSGGNGIQTQNAVKNFMWSGGQVANNASAGFSINQTGPFSIIGATIAPDATVSGNDVGVLLLGTSAGILIGNTISGNTSAQLTNSSSGIVTSVGNQGVNPFSVPANFAQGDTFYASAANGIMVRLSKDTNATRYLSNTGASNNPAWAQVNLANGVTGTLPAGNGGTGITALGTGVATALGVNVGSAGAFVTFNGALGSPSSAGTMPAFTLGGTVSGGANQINNVVIGASTPLAGSFTTLTTTGARTGTVTSSAGSGVQVGDSFILTRTTTSGTSDITYAAQYKLTDSGTTTPLASASLSVDALMSNANNTTTNYGIQMSGTASANLTTYVSLATGFTVNGGSTLTNYTALSIPAPSGTVTNRTAINVAASAGAIIQSDTTDATTTSDGPVRSAGGLSVIKNIIGGAKIRTGSYVVASLPSGSAGDMAFASNCRVFNGAGTQEGAGVGTGGLVTHNGTAWKIAGTNVTAVA